ncbi:MAG: sigma-54 dependent transcriptional regulator [Planctomycetota bacterium]
MVAPHRGPPMDERQLEEQLQSLVTEARNAGLSGRLVHHLQRAALDAAEPVTGPGEIPQRFGMVGSSPAMRALFSLLERVAPSDVSVLITGPTGAGKELVARALHDFSARKGKPFLAENCAAVPAGLLESELFGHVKGAFTGAVADRPGHFVAAQGGTVFLDEIGDMPLEMQAKLLRVLEERRVRPVGSNKTVAVDVRVVAATHRDLAAASASGAFRSDLYYRLNVITLEVPPLRERREDIPLLAEHFRAHACAAMGKEVQWNAGALEALKEHSWPGNVRELNNVVQRAVALSPGIITREDLFEPR